MHSASVLSMCPIHAQLIVNYVIAVVTWSYILSNHRCTKFSVLQFTFHTMQFCVCPLTHTHRSLRHFTVQVDLKCLDTSDLSTELSSPMVRTVPPYGPKCPTLWSEMSHPNFVVYVACSPTNFSHPRMPSAIVY